GRLHEIRLLGLPRHDRAGRHHRAEARAGSDAGGGVQRLRAADQPDHAALHGGGAVERRSCGYLRLSADDQEGYRSEGYPAAESIERSLPHRSAIIRAWLVILERFSLRLNRV